MTVEDLEEILELVEIDDTDVLLQGWLEGIAEMN